jgi:signal transduction histidine kinase/CheY-like chemotaxis protein
MTKQKFYCNGIFCLDQKLIDAIPAPVFMQDEKGDFLGANRAFRKFFGISEDLSTPIDLYGLLGSAAGEKSKVIDNEILTHGGEETFEILVPGSGNSESSVIFTKAAVTGDDDQIVGLVTTLLDLTKQRQIEQQLRHAQKMEAIGTLAGGIAHDFNNVLTPIIGYAEIMRLMAEREKNPDETSKQFVGEILAAAKKAKSLVEQILTFSRSREQKELPQYLHPIVKEVLKLLRVTLPATIKVCEEIDPECGMVCIDPVQLHQVLLNLCTNSAQAIGDDKGQITVRLLRSDLDTQDGEWVELSVTDTGPGIPSDLQERVFEPYFTTKEKSQGTGMGLAMVHGIVSHCGGRVELKSKEEKETAFHLYFPLVPPEKSAEQVMGAMQATSFVGNEHVMVVDDQPAVLRVTEKILETLGYDVTTCASSREALTLFSSQPDEFDLVITDLTMPHLTGMELCVELKKLKATLPVILCSGYGAKLSEEKLQETGFSDWFIKPVTLQKLAAMVRSVIDESK